MFVTPEEIEKRYKEESEQRLADYAEKNRFPEGTFKGRLVTVEDKLSRKNNPMYTVTIRTKKDGAAVDLVQRYMKDNTGALANFYNILKLAGYDTFKIKSEQDLNKIIDEIEEAMPIVSFESVWQKNSTYNNFTIISCDKVCVETVDILDDMEAEVAEVPQDELF